MNIQASTTNLSTISNTAISQSNLSVGSSSDVSKNASTTDTLTISGQGLSMFKESQSASQEALKAATDATTKDENSTLAAVLSTDTEEDSDDTTTTNLTSYTDSQIQSLVADGSISQAEANAELAKRKNTSDEGTPNSATTHVDVQI